jgi:hypothetical protein
MTALVLLIAAFLVVGGSAVSPRAERTVGDLRLDMTVVRWNVGLAEPVAVTMNVTNTSSQPVTITFGGQPYDVLVRQRGALVWQWSHDKAFVQVIRTIELAPGQARTYTAVWDQRDLQGRQVEAGPYDLYWVFMASQRGSPKKVEVGPIRVVIGE